MIDVDTALYRMKAYAGLLLESTTHEQKDIGQDINTLVRWIEHARPLVGAVTPDADPNTYANAQAQAVNPFARHGMSSEQSQSLGHQQKLSPEAEQKMAEVQALYKLPSDEEPKPA